MPVVLLINQCFVLAISDHLVSLLQAFGGGYYRGGFEPKMTKREAALILGVRYVDTPDICCSFYFSVSVVLYGF